MNNNNNPTLTYKCGCTVTLKPGSSSISACERHSKDKQFKQQMLLAARRQFQEFKRQRLLTFLRTDHE